jgi:hypothetical protein
MDNSDNPALERFEQVLDELQLEHAEIAAKRMFGMRSLAVGGKTFARLSGEAGVRHLKVSRISLCRKCDFSSTGDPLAL